MRGTKGAEKIPETQLVSPMVIEPDRIPHEALVRRLASHEADVLLRKHRFDVFSNPNTGTLIEAWDPTEIVIYGVTLDYCVRYALDGLIDLGIPTIHLVLDATKPIVADAVEPLVAKWREQDVRIVTTGDVVCGRIV
jgi:nicotinamidase-related amidase